MRGMKIVETKVDCHSGKLCYAVIFIPDRGYLTMDTRTWKVLAADSDLTIPEFCKAMDLVMPIAENIQRSYDYWNGGKCED